MVTDEEIEVRNQKRTYLQLCTRGREKEINFPGCLASAGVNWTSDNETFEAFKEKVDRMLGDIGPVVHPQAAKATAPIHRIEERSEIPMQNKNFEQVIMGYIEEGKPRGQAIREAVRNFPDLHAAYVERLKNGGLSQPLPMGKSKGKKVAESTARNAPRTFEEAVDSIKLDSQLSHSKAISAAAKKYPELHAEYLDRLRAGKGK